ncbi:MAG: class II aldolase/adducin family protein [Coriobacteriales bacterium]|jgi:L-fuculose-phosphate aldolase
MAKKKKGDKKKEAKLTKKQRKSLEKQISMAIEDEYASVFGLSDIEGLDDPELVIEDEFILDDFDELGYLEMVFSDVGRDLFLSGAITSHGGNLSMSDGETIWISRTGSQLGRLDMGDVIETTWDPSDTDAHCSSELIVHRALYHAMLERCERDGEEFGVRAIVHAHTKYTTLRSFDHDEIAPVDSECKYLIPYAVKVVRPEKSIGSPEAAAMLAQIVRDGEIIGVIGGHGPFAIADSLPGALQLVSSLEHSCFLAEMLDKKNAREKLVELLEKSAPGKTGAGEDGSTTADAIADGVRNVAGVLQDTFGAMKAGWEEASKSTDK